MSDLHPLTPTIALTGGRGQGAIVGRARSDQRGAFDHVERALGGDQAARAGDPALRFGPRRAGQAHRFGQCGVDFAAVEAGAGAVEARGGARAGRIIAADRHQGAKFAPRPGPPAFIGAAAAQDRSEPVEVGDKLGLGDGVA